MISLVQTPADFRQDGRAIAVTVESDLTVFPLAIEELSNTKEAVKAALAAGEAHGMVKLAKASPPYPVNERGENILQLQQRNPGLSPQDRSLQPCRYRRDLVLSQ